MSNIPRFGFLGTQISATNLDQTYQYLKDKDYQKVGYICFPDSSVITMAKDDLGLREVLNQSLLTLPDGKPSQFAARLKGYKNVSTVSGYWLCKQLLNTGLSHYFLGSSPEKLTKIKAKIDNEHPKAVVLGYQTLPFKSVDYFRNGVLLEESLADINQRKPDLIWVGLSSPKQDFLMKFHSPLLQHGVMLGVGGVFDYLSGEVHKSPEWIKKIGLRWAWRLCREPKRLGPKYVRTIQLFVLYFLQKIKKSITGSNKASRQTGKPT